MRLFEKLRSRTGLVLLPAFVLIAQMMVTAGGNAVVCIRDNGTVRYELVCLCLESPAADTHTGDHGPEAVAPVNGGDELSHAGCSDFQIENNGLQNITTRPTPYSPAPAQLTARYERKTPSADPALVRTLDRPPDSNRSVHLSTIVLLI